MFRMLGGSLGIAVTGAIFQGSVGASSFSAASPQQFVHALGHAMSVSAMVALAGAVVGATAIRAKRKSLSLEAVEATAVNPGGSAVAARESV
jgi:hypothetical protein